jgi:hypothetical protein
MASRRAALTAAVWLALSALAGPVSAAVESEYTRLRFLPHQTPDVYLQFQGKWLVVADSAKGLETAKPIKALPNREQTPEGLAERFVFPETELPVSLEGVARVTAVFGITRYASGRSGRGAGRQTEADESDFWDIQAYFHRKDSEGATWRYLILTGGEIAASSDPEGNGHALPMPDINDLTFSLATVPSPDKLQIGLRVMTGRFALSDVRRNDDSRLASVQVTDADGTVVVSETGDLTKFGGFT